MKYSEAIKIAQKNQEFKTSLGNFKSACIEQGISGSIQFAINGEAFFLGYDPCDGFRGGKHNPRRAAYLIEHGETFVINT